MKDKSDYPIGDETVFEKLLNTTLENNFDDFSKCEDKWVEVESQQEVFKSFKSALNVAIMTHNTKLMKYCEKDNIIRLLESGKVVCSPYFIYRIKTNDNKCPICGASMKELRQALSRRDNKTWICSDCGTLEAIDDWTLNER